MLVVDRDIGGRETMFLVFLFSCYFLPHGVICPPVALAWATKLAPPPANKQQQPSHTRSNSDPTGHSR